MVEAGDAKTAPPSQSAVGEVRIVPLRGLPAIEPGTNLAELLADAIEKVGGMDSGDILVVAQKVVSKAEGRIETAESPSELEALIRSESRRVRRRRGDLFIVETHQGFVCATAGIDHSNTSAPDTVILLPQDPDRSARDLSAQLGARFGLPTPVIISDSFGRAWRGGTVDVAIGVAGLNPLVDLRGTLDWSGRELESTQVAVADELAAAAHLVMGKSDGIPAALVRGSGVGRGKGRALDLVMPPDRDLFP